MARDHKTTNLVLVGKQPQVYKQRSYNLNTSIGKFEVDTYYFTN